MDRIFIVVFVLALAVTASAQTKKGTVIKIIDEHKMKVVPAKCADPAAMADYYTECAKHKHHEVQVVRERDNGENLYNVIYYQSENDTMKRHSFGQGLKPLYDKAEYTWDHDTVCVRFFTVGSKKSKVFKGYGWGSSSSAIFED